MRGSKYSFRQKGKSLTLRVGTLARFNLVAALNRARQLGQRQPRSHASLF